MFNIKYFICFYILIAISYYSSAETIKENSDESKAVPNAKSENKNQYLTANDVPECADANNAVGDCIKELIDTIFQRFKNGNKELGVPSLDPFVLNRTTLMYSGSTTTGRFVLKHTTVTGTSKMRHTKMDFRFDKKGRGKGKAIAVTPQFNIVGDYKGTVVVNNAHLKPEGSFNVTLKEVVVTIDLAGELYEKDGHRFLHLDTYDCDSTTKDFHVNATGIFEDKELNDALLTVINASWRDLFKTMLPETLKRWAPEALRVTNIELSLAPLDIFLKNI